MRRTLHLPSVHHMSGSYTQVELGTINYVNLDGSHGNMDAALSEAQRTGKPIFANFVEFPG